MDAKVNSLTVKELEILSLIAAGFSNKQMADRLHVSVGTIGGHMKNIFIKLGVNNRTRAVLLAWDKLSIGKKP